LKVENVIPAFGGVGLSSYLRVLLSALFTFTATLGFISL